MQEWDYTNFLVDLSGFYANCKALERPAGVIHVDRRTPDGESVVAVVGTIEGIQSDVDSTTAYIEELIKQWMASNSYDAHVRRSYHTLSIGAGSNLKVEGHEFRRKKFFTVPLFCSASPNLRGHCAHQDGHKAVPIP